MKNIKLNRRSSMSNQLLDDLLAINVEKVSVEDFNTDDSIEIWKKEKKAVSESKGEKGVQKEQNTCFSCYNH